ncbi:MAG: hypothetical protein JWO30_2099 [Fibrobacteres bacterium]|nr:hypothetical protein [Fibrobacterota bacterium]
MPPRPWLKPLINPLKAVVAIAAALLVYHKVPFASVGPAVAKCRLEFLVLVLVLQLGTVLAQAIRWKTFLRGSDLPLRKFLYFVFLGLFFSLFMPSALASDAVKVFAFGRKYGGTQENIGIALLSKLEGMLVQLAFGAIGLALYADELAAKGAFARLHLDGRAPAIGALALAAVAISAWFFRKRWPAQTWLRTMWDLARDRKLLWQTFSLSFAIQSLSALSLYFLMLSLYPPARLWEIVLLSTAAQAVLLLPFAFGGVGVREFLNLLLFTDIAGIPADTVLAASLLGYVPWVLMALIGGTWMAFRKWSGNADIKRA